ncbi:MAG: acyl-CoA carboxylase biotin carboxyl carrier protein subunit [Nitrososphaerales archaeon]
MQYEIRIEKRSRQVEIWRHEQGQRPGSESYSVTIHNQSRKKQSNIEVIERQPNRLVISIDDKVYAITQLKRTPISVTFVANGRLQFAQLKTKFDEEGSLAPPVSEYITSTLPAKVVKVSAKQGDSLSQGTAMLVLEAMKMEVQILAPKDCRIKEVYVREGESIEKGQKLMWLDFVSSTKA